jgi:transglutaminase-like putative cysteine protease
MRFTITHSTTYRYSAPVALEPHIFRLRPRSDGTQRLISYELQIAPDPMGRSEYLDAEGNSVVQAWFDSNGSPASEMRVLSRFEVETRRENPFDFLLPSPSHLVLTPSPNASDPVSAFAREIARDAGDQTMPFLEGLVQRLFRNWRHAIREKGDPLTPETTLTSPVGSCRDFAVLFCAACRAMGLTARFVSGYEMAAARADHRYMHAWAEVLIPGGGWRGYDPSRGIAVATDHIAVAAAADPALAAPVSGTYRGPAQAAIEAEIGMTIN